jgi:hypothetical protein
MSIILRTQPVSTPLVAHYSVLMAAPNNQYHSSESWNKLGTLNQMCKTMAGWLWDTSTNPQSHKLYERYPWHCTGNSTKTLWRWHLCQIKPNQNQHCKNQCRHDIESVTQSVRPSPSACLRLLCFFHSAICGLRFPQYLKIWNSQTPPGHEQQEHNFHKCWRHLVLKSLLFWALITTNSQ